MPVILCSPWPLGVCGTEALWAFDGLPSKRIIVSDEVLKKNWLPVCDNFFVAVIVMQGLWKRGKE